MTSLVIEPEGQASVTIVIEEFEIVFEDVGIQGPPGPASAPESGDAIRVVGEVVNVDISRLTLAP